jgi:plasmid maintenance system killer protein
MNLQQIKAAVERGERVFLGNDAYEVIQDDNLGQWLIRCSFNGYCIGLTWADGKTLNGKPEDFFIRP